MSGTLTGHFAVAAMFVPGLYKYLFGALTISGVFSSYQIWKRDRQRANTQG
jgi:hypothetical protein